MVRVLYLLFLAALIPLYHFCTRATGGFSIARISYAPSDGADLTDLPDLKILDQKFTFLGSGGQCFAFASEDGKYVLKFAKRHFAPEFLLQLPLTNALHERVMKRVRFAEKKWRRNCDSTLLAFRELKAESGLLFAHMTRTHTLQKKVTIVDKLGIAHTLDLDAFAFSLQKKGQPLLPYLQHLVSSGKTDEAKRALEKVVQLIAHRCQKGIFDEDPRLLKNLGFLDGEPFFIDLGRFKRDASRANLQDLACMTRKLRAWLLAQDPALAEHLDTLVEHAHAP